MRRACLWSISLSLAGLAIGCGGAATPAPAASACAATSGGEDARDQRIQELEASLATRTAEVQSLRSALASGEERQVVRIGDDATSGADERVLSDFTTLDGDGEVVASASSSSRPVLRLYGAPPPPSVSVLAGPAAPAIVAAPPTGALGRLPVVLTPGAPDAVPAIPTTPVVVAPDPPAPLAPAPEDEVAAAEYRAALAHVSAREWDLALEALGRFVQAHPDHAYADNAMYWRGEVLYARRDYAGAITELTRMVERFPHGNKVPDALLRIGFAYERLGEPERAREMFRRVREQFPGTVAARSAPMEDV
ncbi:MAG: tol-pal system protein YbgF [Sandaracinus sp.]